MAAKNPDSLTPATGEFKPSKPPSEPLEHGGHQTGRKVGPKDYAPEFHAETLPPGTAPADRTFAPNPVGEVPGQADNDLTLRSHGKESTYTSAESTLGGTDSGAVNQGLGKPIQGETSTEIRMDGKHSRKREKHGGEGQWTGGSGLRDDGNAEAKRLLKENEKEGPTSGHPSVYLAGAEDKGVPEPPETVARENS